MRRALACLDRLRTTLTSDASLAGGGPWKCFGVNLLDLLMVSVLCCYFPILDLRCVKWLGSSGRPSRAGSGGIAGHGTGRGDVPVTICPALPGGLPVRSPRRGRGGDELPALVRSPRLSLSSVLRRAGCRGLRDPGPGPAPRLYCALLRRRTGARARSSHGWSAAGCLCQGRAEAPVPQLSARSTQRGGGHGPDGYATLRRAQGPGQVEGGT